MNSKKLTIIHCVGINSHGGREYLKYIINDYANKNYFLFLDARIDPRTIKAKKYKRFTNNLLLRIYILSKRIIWKITNKKQIEELYINGIPPLFKINDSNKITIMFQNVFLLDPSYNKYLNLQNKIKFNLLRKFIKTFLKKSYDIQLQTNSMIKHFKKLNKKYNKVIINKRIWIDYFNNVYKNEYNLEELRENFQNFNIVENIINSGSTTYFYPASFEKHKNHYRLIKAFEKLPNKVKKNAYIFLTINKEDISKITEEPHIIAIGVLNRNFLNYLFSKSNFLIFPSLVESLGIPVLEARYSNLKIISSNIEVIAEISNPFLKFKPKSIDEISKAIINSHKTISLKQ